MLDVLLVILHVKHALIIQALVQVVNLESDFYKLPDHNKLVSDNALMEPIQRIMSVKSATLNA
jgi:hypothetical protein